MACIFSLLSCLALHIAWVQHTASDACRGQALRPGGSQSRANSLGGTYVYLMDVLSFATCPALSYRPLSPQGKRGEVHGKAREVNGKAEGEEDKRAIMSGGRDRLFHNNYSPISSPIVWS